MTSSYVSSIQALRGIAALLVLIGHVLYEGYSSWGTVKFHYPFGVGVHIFFVISGFVIAYNSPKFFGVPGGIKKFLWRRALRIVPLYWFYTSLMLLALFLFPEALQTARYDFWHAVQSYLFIPHINPAGAARPILSLGWTLNYEMYFYLVFAVFMLLPLKFFMPALSSFFVLTTLLWLILPPEWSALKFWSSPIVLEFLAGAWIGYLRYKNFSLPRLSFWPLALCTALAFGALYFIPPAYLLPLMGGASVLLILTATLPAGIERLKAPEILCALGDSSYSLYLSHAFVIGIMGLLWSWIFADILNPYAYMALSIVIAAAAGHIAYWLIERPLLVWIAGGNSAASRSSLTRT
jgi:exopolysaccharide production protein ExoZ